MDLCYGFVTAILIVFLYFLPALIASQRKKKNRNAITVANLLFGWTIIGWAIILIWSLTED